LIVGFAAIITAAFLPVYLRCKTNPVIAAAITVWGALATVVVWGVRPQILSLLLTSIWLLILERSEEKPALLWWTLPLIVLWVNLHAGFILGPVFLGLFLLGEALEHLLATTRVARARLRWLAFALFPALLLIPLNPNGVAIFWYPIATLTSRAMQHHITEWASPDFHNGDYLPLLLLILATFGVIAGSRCRLRARDLVLLLVSLAAALSSVRMIPLFVLIAVPLVARPVAGWIAKDQSFDPAGPPASALVNACILAGLIALTAIRTGQVIHRQPQAEAALFPTSAAAYLRQHPPTGPIFNFYDWGGYLIFKLHPTVRVFIDGRADLYGDDLLQQFIDVYYLQGPWQQPLSKWQITAVVVPVESPLASALRVAPGWSLEYHDSTAAIFSRSPIARRPSPSLPATTACALRSGDYLPASAQTGRRGGPPVEASMNPGWRVAFDKSEGGVKDKSVLSVF
jgi:hypothetical protein